MKNSMKSGAATFTVISLAAFGLLSAPSVVIAQQKPENSETVAAENRLISLDLEEGDLYAAFNSLFKQAKVNYTLNGSLKGTTITTHIKLPMRQAVNALIKISGLPIMLSVENSVYAIVPKPVEKAPEPDGPVVDPIIGDETGTPGTARRMARIPIRHINSIDFAAMMGLPVYLYTSSLIYHGHNPFYTDPIGSSPGAVPNVAGGANGNGSNGSGANGPRTPGGAGLPLPEKLTPADIFVSDMDATGFYALFRGL